MAKKILKKISLNKSPSKTAKRSSRTVGVMRRSSSAKAKAAAKNYDMLRKNMETLSHEISLQHQAFDSVTLLQQERSR